MTKIDTLIFDLGGVLIDWNPRHLYRKLFVDDEAGMEKFLAEICNNEWNLQQDAGRPFAQAVAELSAIHPQYQPLIEAYHLRWIEMITGAIEPTVNILQQLHQANYSLYALSNWSTETFALVRDQYPFLKLFKRLFISGELKLIKPQPAIFQYLLTEIDRSAAQCLFIDDALVNINAAKQLGFHTHHFTSAENLAQQLRQLGLQQ